MSDRRLRTDNRGSHHGDGYEESRRKSGAVQQLTPEDIAAMEPNKPTPKRINVTAEDDASRAAGAAARIAEIEAMTWDDQREEIRRANARYLALVTSNDQLPPTLLDKLTALQKVSTIAKQWVVEERQAPPLDTSKLTDEQLEKLVEARAK